MKRKFLIDLGLILGILLFQAQLHAAGLCPIIYGSLHATAVVNSPFYYQIKAAGATGYFATGLPPGLSKPDALGQIKGTFTQISGPYTITLYAFNAHGTTQATLHLNVISGTTGAHSTAGYVIYGSDHSDLQLPSGGSPQTLTFKPVSQSKYYLSLDSRYNDLHGDKGESAIRWASP